MSNLSYVQHFTTSPKLLSRNNLSTPPQSLNRNTTTTTTTTATTSTPGNSNVLTCFSGINAASTAVNASGTVSLPTSTLHLISPTSACITYNKSSNNSSSNNDANNAANVHTPPLCHGSGGGSANTSAGVNVAGGGGSMSPRSHYHHSAHHYSLHYRSSTARGAGDDGSGGGASALPHNFSVDAASYQQIMDRRKSFRNRGSLGPTVASAPSVEQEDYRTPKPTVDSIKNGKSFDFGGCANAENSSFASESNGLIKVSADFLRLNGSRQQFRSLLSRKKLGQMPPAYTRIDYSHDSIESNNTGIGGGVRHPLITVEDAAGCASTATTGGSTLATSSLGAITAAAADAGRRPSISSTAATAAAVVASLLTDCGDASEKAAATAAALNENGASMVGGGGGGGGAGSNQFLMAPPVTPNAACFKRNNSRYGVPIDESAVKMVYKIRSQRLLTRVRITNRCVVWATLGILLMVIDMELSGQALFGVTKDHPLSLVLRACVALSTVILLVEIVRFHINEVLLELVDCGADDFRVVLTWRRCTQFGAEFLICAMCPLPFTGTIEWTFVEPSRYRGDHTLNAVRRVPVDILLALAMLARCYLIGRFMVLHSKQFQDASTRTLAALNRIQVNFAFVVKTVLDQRPVVFLSVFLLIFWITTAWTFAQCERFGRDDEQPSLLYTNALWFIAITFNGNGYGDIVPKTIAGKMIAVLVGIIGAVMSSILIAVISRKILLSQGQRNVNNFMNDSRLIQDHKNAAARVLQKTWHIYKCLQCAESPDHVLRKHQRKFLDAIHRFRRIKNKIRVFNENSSTSLQQMNRLMTEMHTSMQRLVGAQEEMRSQIELLQRAMRATTNAVSMCGASGGVAPSSSTTADYGAYPTAVVAVTSPVGNCGADNYLYGASTAGYTGVLPSSTTAVSNCTPPRVVFASNVSMLHY